MGIIINTGTKVRDLLSDERFLDLVAKQLVITWAEFELNWEHQMVGSYKL